MDVVHSEERRFTPEGIEIDIGQIVFVCECVCVSVCPRTFVNSSGSAERSERDKHHSMRQSAGTTMALVTWRHVPRGTCHVPPREPLAKQHELDTFFEGTVAETRNLQGRCTLVRRMCHVSGDPEGSKLCPQGTIPFFSLMPLAQRPLDPGTPNFVQGCRVTRSFKIMKFRGVQKLGGSKFRNFHFYEKKQHELDKIFDGTVAEIPNLQGRCTLVWRMCHVSE